MRQACTAETGELETVPARVLEMETTEAHVT